MSKKDKSHSKTSTSGKKVVVGYDEYVNKRTGEVEEFAVMRATQADWNFEKLWLFKLVELLDLVGNSKVRVLVWMLENRDSENRIIATQSVIAEGAGVSLKTVSRLLGEMREEDLISSPQNGVYRLTPDLIWKGSHPSRMNILMQFRKEAQDSENEDAEYESLQGAAE